MIDLFNISDARMYLAMLPAYDEGVDVDKWGIKLTRQIGEKSVWNFTAIKAQGDELIKDIITVLSEKDIKFSF